MLIKYLLSSYNRQTVPHPLIFTAPTTTR